MAGWEESAVLDRTNHRHAVAMAGREESASCEHDAGASRWPRMHPGGAFLGAWPMGEWEVEGEQRDGRASRSGGEGEGEGTAAVE
jgi:hypothetical protein